MNLFSVTPTFQSARLAGWKTGATNLNGFKIMIQEWAARRVEVPRGFAIRARDLVSARRACRA